MMDKEVEDDKNMRVDNFSIKMNPLKTTKQRNTNNHRKNQRSSVVGMGASTDEEDHRHVVVSATSHRGDPSIAEDEEVRREDGKNSGNEERLSCMAKLNLNRVGGVPLNCGEKGGLGTMDMRVGSYPSFPESDSLELLDSGGGDMGSVSENPGQIAVGQGATTGASEAMDDSSCIDSLRRLRRRRRRRGHNTSTKRMAVDATPVDEDVPLCVTSTSQGYYIRPSERPGPSKKLDKVDGLETSDSLDGFGIKRKRAVQGIQEDAACSFEDVGHEMDIVDVGALSLNSPGMVDDEEMKSDEEYSSLESENEIEDDVGREADDEQSDWVFDEWSPTKKSQAESASSRKKRLMMLRSYNSVISAHAGVGPSSQGLHHQSREIRAGKRRVHVTKPILPLRGIWTSANEEVSKFLQDPMQSQIRLQALPFEEGINLGHLASLYSLRMDYCENQSWNNNKIASPSVPASWQKHDEELDASSYSTQLFPVLTKTSNTTQMDKKDDSTHSFAEGSSSSNVSSVYGPAVSDMDSKISDSKRIKK